MKRIVVDLTPVLPGGENGGAKTMTIELLRQLGFLHRECKFVLLTADPSHDELDILDAPNMRRVIVHRTPREQSTARTWGRRIGKLLPAPVEARIKRLYMYRLGTHRGHHLLATLGADLLFCPFTAPFFYDPQIPIVSVIYDLQHRCYPQFFSSDEIYNRDRNLSDALNKATCLVCISEYVRNTVLENSSVSPDRVRTIHIQIPFRLANAAAEVGYRTLARLYLTTDQFLLYPANFWMHKNHQMLLTAYGIYRARFPDSVLKLVCTGAPGPRLNYFRDAVAAMNLEDKVISPGYLDDAELAALMANARAVIFPSLYEGFGMPVVESMALGKPVLCSNVASLPEVAGGAALFFDPTRPTEIVEAIRRIEVDTALVSELVESGKQRVTEFGSVEKMAEQYWDVFCAAASGARRVDALHGVYADGWCSELMRITHQQSNTARQLALELTAAPWLPYRRLSIELLRADGKSSRYKLRRGKQLVIEHDLPNQGGVVELKVTPVFQPQNLNMSGDTRSLGCQVQSCQIKSVDRVVDLFKMGPVQ